MTGPTLLLLLLLALLGGALVSAATAGRREQPLAPLDAASAHAVRTTTGRARSRALLGLVAAAATAVGLLALQGARPGWLGLPLAVAPGLAASAGLLVFSAVPAARRPPAPATSGSLDRRHPWSFAGRRPFAVPALAGAVLVVALGAGAALASPDAQGRRRTFTAVSADGVVTGTASPFPGGYYGLPVLVVALLLLAAAWLALHRVATTSALPGPGLQAADRRWRTASTRVVSRMATAALLGYAGGVLAVGGSAVHRTAAGMALNGVDGFGAAATGAAVVAVLGALLLLLGGVAVGGAVAAALGTTAAPAPVAVAAEQVGSGR